MGTGSLVWCSAGEESSEAITMFRDVSYSLESYITVESLQRQSLFQGVSARGNRLDVGF